MTNRSTLAAVIAAAGILSANAASAMPVNRALTNATPANVEQVRWYGNRGGYGRRGGWGWGVGGFAAGALLGSALARPYYGYPYYPAPAYYPPPAYAAAPGGDAVAYCMQRYRSYDPRSGTFLGYDGLRHPCP